MVVMSNKHECPRPNHDNWDGYGGIPTEESCYKNVELFLNAADNFPEADIYPNPNGTISIEWENQKGEVYLEIGNTRFILIISQTDEKNSEMAGTNSELLTLVLPRIASFFESKDNPL